MRRLKFALIGLLAVLGILPAYLRAYNLIGSSEVPTALIGDKLLANHAAYRLNLPYTQIPVFRTGHPKRDDIVVVHLLHDDRLRTSFFKRVIALPGETIELRENQVFIDGRALPLTPLPATDFAWVPKTKPVGSSFASEDSHWIAFTPGAAQVRNYGPVKIASAHYFIMGDNRDNSLDSRGFGAVSEDEILGKVVRIFATGPRAN